MNLKRLCTVTLALAAFTSPLLAADLTETDKEFLNHYTKVQAALAADDLAGAKNAATEMGEEGKPLAESAKIADARNAFEKLSAKAIPLAKGQPDYYVVNCPMVKKDWVQPKGSIANPYAGKSMLTCGVVKK